MKANKTSSIVGWAIVAVICVFALYVGINVHKRQRELEANRAAAEEFEQRLATAARNSDVPLSDAMAEQAEAEVIALLDSEPDAKRRFLTAAVAFHAYYLKSTRILAAYCKDQGIDITPFVSAFDRANAAERARAKQAFEDLPRDVEKKFDAHEPQMRKAVELEMNDAASRENLSIQEACESLVVDPEELAKQTTFAQTLPMAHKALMTPF